MAKGKLKKKKFFDRFLTFVEKGGNALPHPATLFGIFALLVLILSGVAYWVDWSAVHPATGEEVHPVNLLTVENLHRMMNMLVDNTTGFAPLGVVFVAMLGIGIAESSGLVSAVIRMLVLSSPKRILTFVLVFSGILSNMASDIGYVLLIPLAGAIFIAVKRHPIVGMAAAFAGVSGGFSANLLIGTIDPLLAGLSTEAAEIIDPTYDVNPTANYYFMVVSTFVIAIGGTWVTERFVAPRFGEYTGEGSGEELERLRPEEKRGLFWAMIAFLIIVGFLLAGIIPDGGYLRGPGDGVLNSPIIKGVIAVLVLVAGVTGVVYGWIAGTFKNDSDVMNGMSRAMKTLSLYFVLVFFAAQFVAYFKWSNLGIIFAIKGADLLSSLNVGLVPLIIAFILLAALINMFMGSASAKWAILAPIFIPMFMLMGYSPELSQVIFRIGDSVTNIISPMMSFFALIIAFMQKYKPDAGIGTVIATMLPYSIAFFILWSLLLIVWVWIGLPLGPGAELYYQMPE
ncbi:MAG: AbgT family transporter [Candidatus Kapaibacterium sp.]